MMGVSNAGTPLSHQMDYITDIREYDVPYHMRVAIDNKINVVCYYYYYYYCCCVNGYLFIGTLVCS